MKYKLFKGSIIVIAFYASCSTVAAEVKEERLFKQDVETIVERTLLRKPYPPLTQWLKAKYDRLLKNWSIQPINLIGHQGPIRAVEITPDGSKIVTGSEDKTVKIWDIETGKNVYSLRYASPIYSVAIFPDGSKIVTGSGDGMIEIRGILHDKRLLAFKGYQYPITSVLITPDGSTLVTKQANEIKIWDTAGTLKYVLSDPASIKAVAITPDGSKVVTGPWSPVGHPKIWDINTGGLVHAYEDISGSIFSIAVTPDGSQIVAGFYDDGYTSAKIWDINTGRVMSKLKGHEGPIYAIAVTADGKKVVTGSQDKDAGLWDIKTGELITVFKGHSDTIWAVAVTPAGSKVVTGSLDNTAKIWNWDFFAELKKLTLKQIQLLSWIYQHAVKGQKADLAQETEATIEHIDQYALLPDLIKELVADDIKLP